MPIESVDRNVIHRSYYYANCDDFLNASEAEIHDEIVQHSMQFDLTAQQNIAWNEEIRILKQVMRELGDGQIAFEYTIPRMGRRVDVVIIRKGQIFLLEFKVFEKEYPKNAVDQAVDYAVDLHNFHEASHNTDLFPVLVCTEAPIEVNNIVMRNHIASPMRCNEHNLASEIKRISEAFETSESLDANAWVNSSYKPTPTIIEAAQALYAGHDVREISHKESDDNDIAVTTACIDEIIENSKRNGWKSICFVTGVPGTGKTLVGLNIANRRHRFNTGDEEHAVFLSGNEPLVTVLREALTRDQDEKRKQVCDSCKKTKKRQDRDCDNCKFHLTKEAIFKETKSFIQMIHWFRDDSLLDGHPAPIDKIAIFDEAQRAWKKEKLSNFMRTKKGQPHFDMSEPECLIEYMNRHRDWATIVCLVGGGQEIHDGEAGISEWFNALNTHFPDWKVFCSDRMTDSEYVGDSSVDALLSNVELHKRSELHLSVSMRSFRSELVSAFAKAVIDADVDEARRLYTQITEANADGSMKYPIILTRDLTKAKQWVKKVSLGTERYGIVASSSAKRLRADGVIVPKDIEVEKWFLNGKDDVNSSYFMEVAVSEFKIQGLEIDYAVVAWEGDYRFHRGEFTYNDFKGTAWNKINNQIDKDYLKNSYRVLLTRSRQGFIIYVPKGSNDDITRDPKFYDETYEYLKSIGIVEI